MRAQRTFELLNLGIKDPLPWKEHGLKPDYAGPVDCTARVEVTEDIREWDCKYPCPGLGPSTAHEEGRRASRPGTGAALELTGSWQMAITRASPVLRSGTREKRRAWTAAGISGATGVPVESEC